MQFQIADLLDELQEVNVDILPNTAASEKRIKELTMKKLKTDFHRRNRRGLGLVRKLLIAAAILALIAVPVLAASGLIFTDWTAGYQDDNIYDYDKSPSFGAGSKVWEASNWTIRISAENASSTGLTIVCEELGAPNKSGSLTVGNGFWLEKWNGTEYAPLEGNVPTTSTVSIQPGATTRQEVSWEDVYGSLSSGSYRLGQIFTCTDRHGKAEDMTFYAKFRIFEPEMATYLDKANSALDALHNQYSYHLRKTVYPTQELDYTYYVEEIWKAGKDYLLQIRYYGTNGQLLVQHGYLYRNSLGYSLEWVSEDIHSEIAVWESADFVDADYHDTWDIMFTVYEGRLGEVYDDGHTVSFVEFHDTVKPEDYDLPLEEVLQINPYINHDYTEKDYTFDDAGNLISIMRMKRTSMDPESTDIHLTDKLEVLSTPSSEIVEIINSQDLSSVPTFSWADDWNIYGETGLTEGFANTAPQNIASTSDVIRLARTELDPDLDKDFRDGNEYNMSIIYRDETAGMWKVVFKDSQDDFVTQMIYLDNTGRTVLIVIP